MSERLKDSEQALFDNNLQIVQSTLDKNQVLCALVGGVALNGYMGRPVSARRSNGSLRDIDIQALGPDPEKIKQTRLELRELGAQLPLFPDVGLESPIFEDEPYRPRSWHLLSSTKVTEHGVYLVYQEIEMRVPDETVALQPVEVNGIQFTTFPGKTQLYRYLTRGGVAKPKDLDKLSLLEHAVMKNWHNEPDDTLYAPYLEFADQVRDRYTHAVSLYDAYWRLDNRLGGLISGSSWLYSLINQFRR